MAERIGEYITNQYGLLKHILSCLEPQDLRTAKLVCRDWSGAIEAILSKNPAWLVYRISIDSWKFPRLQQPMLPSLVLYFSASHNCQYLEVDCCTTCGTEDDVYQCPCTTSDSGTVFAVVAMSTITGMINHDNCDREKLYSFLNDPSALFFPRNSPELSVSTYNGGIPKNALAKGKSDDFVNKCLGGPEPIKCLIILSNGANAREVKKFIDKIVERQGLTFAVGGGITEKTEVKVGFGKNKLNGDFEHLIIAIRGHNVTAHSDVLVGYKYQPFMQEMAQRVGPLPANSTRIAFLAQCLNRAHESIEIPESKAFKEAFPLVTQFGFKAYGEYGIRSCSEAGLEQAPPSKKKKATRKFKHENTTSIVILTFKNI